MAPTGEVTLSTLWRTARSHEGVGGRRRARCTAAVALAGLVLPFLAVVAAVAAPVTWYRTGATATPGYASLADAPGTSSFVTTVDHGDGRGAFLFRPGRRTASATGFPGTEPAGAGYATTATLTGTLPGGTWTFDATVRTDTPAGAANGVLAVAVYRVGDTTADRIAFAQGSTNVLAGPGDRAVSISAAVPELTLADERIVTEWYLVVDRTDASAAGASTSLRHGAAADTVTVPGRVQAPALGPPGTLTVTGVGDNRVSLSWEPSSDSRTTAYVVRRATGPSGPWTDVTTVTATSHDDAALTNGTRYYHTVVAVAADGTRSVSSNATSAVPSDTQAPAAPTSVAVSPDGSFRLRVTWTASSSGDVAGYEVQRSGSSAGPYSPVAGPVTGTVYTDTGLPSGSTWHYRLVTVDDDGLRSTATVPAAGTVAPPPPTGLRVAAVADGAVALEWDGVSGAATYRVERSTGGAFTVAGTTAGPSFTDGGLVNGTTYSYRVRAIDAAGGASSPSSTVTAVPRDTGLPAPPTGLAVTERAGDEVRLTWTPSASSSTVGYRVFRARADGPLEPISGLIARPRFDDGPLPVGVPHRYEVVAEDASGSRSIPATASYTVAPAAPGNLRITGLNETSVQLRWDPTDDPRSGYRVLRADDGPDGPYTAVSGLLTGTTFTDSGLLLGEEYHYVVQAEAVDGTRSDSSNRLRVVPVNGPPTPPTGLVATDTGAGGEVSLTWPQSLEPDVVTYRIERRSGGAWAAIATTSATTYLDTGLITGRTYEYRLVAIDSVGFESDPSEPVSVVPTDTEPPPAPGQPTVSQIGTSLQVQWPPVPTAVSYVVLRSTDVDGPFSRIGTVAGTRSLRDEEVSRGVTYHYVVQATDAAGNVSPPSPVASGLVRAASLLPTTNQGDTGGSADGTDGTDGAVDGPAGPVFPTAPPGDTPTLEPDVPPPGSVDEPPLAAPDGEAPSSGGGSGSAVDADTIFVAAPDGPSAVQEGSAADEALRALAEGDLGRALQRTAEDVADKVGDVALAFRVPLVLLLLLVVYMVVQGRIDRSAVLAAPEAATGGEDDDVEYVL